MTFPWQGNARPLSPGAFTRTAATLGCEEAALRAVWEVEASGRYWGPDGGVIRRFEPHKMPGAATGWRDSLRLSTAEREAMFRDAWARDPSAALDACSWGAPQIMGFNAGHAGYHSAREMVEAMAESEDAHLHAFAAFVSGQGLDGALRRKDWRAFARGYNGSGQVDTYARRMAAAYARSGVGTLVRIGSKGDLVRALQSALKRLGYLPGAIDGDFGRGTRAALLAFQADNDLATDGVAGPVTWAALETAAPKPVSVERQSLTAADLRAKGSTTIRDADIGTGAIAVSGAGAAAGQVNDWLDKGREATDTLREGSGLFAQVSGIFADNWPFLVTVVALGVGFFAFRWIQAERARKARTGEDMSR